MYISRIKLENIRGFGPLFDLRLQDGNERPRLRNVVIGKNGTCKTTLLRCLALGVCWREDAHALLAEPIGQMLSEGQDEGVITVSLVGKSNAMQPIEIVVKLQRDSARGEFVEEVIGREQLKEQLLVCGIGAARSGEGADEYRKYQIVDSVYSLFNYQQSALCSIELTLRRLRDYKTKRPHFYKSVLNGIMSALDLPKDASIDVSGGGGVTISAPGVGQNLPLQAWADGYRITMNWILDVFAWAMRANAINERGNVEGIVLIDEIEQHIHPSLHIHLLGRLSALLPDAQLFVTTHSPLTALAARPEEIVSLKRKKHGLGVVAQEAAFDFSGYSASDMLEDERLFDSQAHRPEVEEQLDRYRKLATKVPGKRTKKETAELSQLASALNDTQKPNATKSSLLQELESIAKRYDL